MAKRNRLTDLKVTEVSAVDRAANKGARAVLLKRETEKTMGTGLYLAKRANDAELHADVLTYLKREFSDDERQRLAGTGAALPDGCLSGDTIIETRLGERQIADVVGIPTDVFTDAGWAAAEIKGFGDRALVEVTLVRGKERRSILATLSHRWYTRRGVVHTASLMPGDAVPHVIQDRAEAEIFEPAEHAVASMAKQPAHALACMAVIDHEWRPLSAGRRMSAAATRHALADCTLPVLSGEHPIELGIIDAILTRQNAASFGEPSRVSNSDLRRGFGSVSPLADFALGSVAAPAAIEFGDGFFDLAESANDVRYRGFDGENSFHIPHVGEDWHIEQVRPTGLIEPVFCAVVPGLNRFVLAGGVLTGNSFPISNRQDLKNAIRAIGRAKNRAKAKAHIISRARSLDATSLLPDDWKVSKRAFLSAVSKADAEEGLASAVTLFKEEQAAVDFNGVQADAEAREYACGLLEEIDEAVCSLRTVFMEIDCDPDIDDKSEALQESLEQFKAHIQGIIPEGVENAMVAAALTEAGFELTEGGALTKRDEDQMGIATAEIKKSLGLSATATDAEVLKALEAASKRAVNVLKMSDKHSSFMQNPKAKMPKGGKEAFADMEPSERDEHMDKNPVEPSDEEKAEKARKEKEDKEKADAEEAKKRAGDEVLKVGGVEIRKSAVGEASFAVIKADQERIQKLEDAATVVTIEKRTAKLEHIGKADELATLIHGIAKHDAKLAEAVEKKFEQLEAVIAKGALFTEVGKSSTGMIGKAGETIEAKAREIMSKNSGMTIYKARTKAREENPELAKEEEEERKSKAKAA